MLGNIRLPLQVDIGVGDAINPPPTRLAYPTLLDQPQPVVWVDPRETLIAEKFAAMVVLGRRNSRIKDVWDIAALATDFAFDGPGLRQAVPGHPAATRSLAGDGRGRPRADLLRRSGPSGDVVRLALVLDRSVHDCVYPALPHRIGGTLVTADLRFANALAPAERGRGAGGLRRLTGTIPWECPADGG